MRILNRIMVCVVTALVVSTPAWGGEAVKMTIVEETAAVEMFGQSQPARTDTSTMWLSGDAGYFISSRDNMAVLIGLADSMIHLMNKSRKTYTSVSLTEGVAGLLEEGEGQEELKQYLQHMGEGVSVTVADLDSSATINGFDDAKLYEATMKLPMGMTSTMRIWTAETGHDTQFARLARSLQTAALALLGDLGNLNEEFAKISGMPIATRTATVMMGNTMEQRTDVVSIDEMEAPEGIFGIPEDFSYLSPQEFAMQR